MKKSTGFLILFLLIALSCTVAGIIIHYGKHSSSGDGEDYCAIAYSDIISFVVQGYQCHWEGMSPDEMSLSDVYGYESECGAFAQQDINGDGIPELLLGDDFGDGGYRLYDIFTFDAEALTPVHLLSGGERDSFVVNSGGTIIETGSNSAFDSFTRYYRIKGAALEETDSAEEDLMAPDFDQFMRYIAPAAYVVLDNDGVLLGRLVRTLDEGYETEAQDTAIVPKENARIEFWSARDGRGVVSLKNPGSETVFAFPDAESNVLGEATYEQGFCPECYPCLGYRRGWFRIEFEGKEGFISEEAAEWDFADRN